MKKVKGLLALVIIAFIAVFVASNTQEVGVRFLTIKVQAPAAFIVLISSVAGVMLWPLVRAVFQSDSK